MADSVDDRRTWIATYISFGLPASMVEPLANHDAEFHGGSRSLRWLATDYNLTLTMSDEHLTGFALSIVLRTVGAMKEEERRKGIGDYTDMRLAP